MMKKAPSIPATILIVDDDVELCELLKLRLKGAGYLVSVQHGVATALESIMKTTFDCVILDLRLLDGDGFQVLDGISKRAPDVPVIVLTAHGTIESAVEAMRRGAYGFVTKPFHNHDLLQKIAHAVESAKLRRELAGLRRIVGEDGDDARILGVSSAIEHVRTVIGRIAPSDATVLILGESGTGKELAARAIHALSPRARAPFVAVNCAALAPDLLESTLFGHVKGAFTGAVSDREGLFGAAQKGTLFLDEVGEMPPAVQAKLLRVLQERRFSRLGSTLEHEADVRIVAATNRDLRQEVTDRRFREDLFYRLHVVPIAMPALRERGDDILLLAEMFLQRSAARHGLPIPRLSPRAITALVAHSWPGNVRELANVMEAAVLLCRGEEVELDHLSGIAIPNGVTSATVETITLATERVLAMYAGPDAPPPPPLREARDAFECAYLDLVLKRTGGNVAHAAKMSGRNRTDFYDLLRRHGRTPAAYKT